MRPRNRQEEVLGELRRLAGDVDPVPGEVTSFARAALGWRRIDAELAELLTDSVLDPAWASRARSGAAPAREVTFRAADLEIALSIQERDPGLVLLGQLAPPGADTVEVQRDDSSEPLSEKADELGRFRIELTEGGRIRLRVPRKSPASSVETSWIGI